MIALEAVRGRTTRQLRDCSTSTQSSTTSCTRVYASSTTNATKQSDSGKLDSSMRLRRGLLLGQCTDEYRLFACFDALVSVAEAREQCQVLVERVRRDATLMVPLFFSSSRSASGGVSLSWWP